MAIKRCPYCKAMIDDRAEFCSNCGTKLLFPEDELIEEDIPGEKVYDVDKSEAEPEPVKPRKRRSRKKKAAADAAGSGKDEAREEAEPALEEDTREEEPTGDEAVEAEEAWGEEEIEEREPAPGKPVVIAAIDLKRRQVEETEASGGDAEAAPLADESGAGEAALEEKPPTDEEPVEEESPVSEPDSLEEDPSLKDEALVDQPSVSDSGGFEEEPPFDEEPAGDEPQFSESEDFDEEPSPQHEEDFPDSEFAAPEGGDEFPEEDADDVIDAASDLTEEKPESGMVDVPEDQTPEEESPVDLEEAGPPGESVDLESVEIMDEELEFGGSAPVSDTGPENIITPESPTGGEGEPSPPPADEWNADDFFRRRETQGIGEPEEAEEPREQEERPEEAEPAEPAESPKSPSAGLPESPLLFPAEEFPESPGSRDEPEFKTADLEKMVDPAEKEKEEIERFLDSLKKERKEIKAKYGEDSTELPPWAKQIRENEQEADTRPEAEFGDSAWGPPPEVEGGSGIEAPPDIEQEQEYPSGIEPESGEETAVPPEAEIEAEYTDGSGENLELEAEPGSEFETPGISFYEEDEGERIEDEESEDEDIGLSEEEPLEAPSEDYTSFEIPEDREERDEAQVPPESIPPFDAASVEEPKIFAGLKPKRKLPGVDWLFLLKARVFDFLFIAALWFITLWIASRLTQVSVFKLIGDSLIVALGFYAILLGIYFFFFIFFLGETLGNQLFAQDE